MVRHAASTFSPLQVIEARIIKRDGFGYFAEVSQTNQAVGIRFRQPVYVRDDGFSTQIKLILEDGTELRAEQVSQAPCNLTKGDTVMISSYTVSHFANFVVCDNSCREQCDNDPLTPHRGNMILQGLKWGRAESAGSSKVPEFYLVRKDAGAQAAA